MDVDDVDLERQRLRYLLVRNFGAFKQIVMNGARVIPVAKSPQDLIEDYLTRKYRDHYRPRRERTHDPRRMDETETIHALRRDGSHKPARNVPIDDADQR